MAQSGLISTIAASSFTHCVSIDPLSLRTAHSNKTITTTKVLPLSDSFDRCILPFEALAGNFVRTMMCFWCPKLIALSADATHRGSGVEICSEISALIRTAHNFSRVSVQMRASFLLGVAQEYFGLHVVSLWDNCVVDVLPFWF